MTTATGSIYGLESQAWHRIENFAVSHPNAARWLGIATAIGIFVKDILFPPVRCVENSILAVKRYTEYSKEIDLVKKEEIHKVYKSHVVEAFKNLIKLPLSPLIGICEAVYSLILMFSNPLATAKMEAAKADLESHMASDANPNDPGLEFAKKAALERFSARVKSLQKPEDLAAVNFMQTQEERDDITAEVRIKREKYNAGIQAMKDHRIELGKGEKAQNKYVKEIFRRIEAYAEFEIELGKADADKAQTMNFDPTTIVVKEDADEADATAANGANTADTVGKDAPAPDAGKVDDNLKVASA